MEPSRLDPPNIIHSDSGRNSKSRHSQASSSVNMHPADLELPKLLDQCETKRIKRGGPGGQHRNKTASAVVLKHLPTGITAEANERRDQSVNLQRAIFRLRVQLALEVRTRRSAVPSPLWLSRCPRGRIAIDPEHEDFPRILAEALDVIEQCGDDAQRAAKELVCSLTQLVKLLSLDGRGLALLNGRRATRGLRPLKSRKSE